MPQGHIKPIPCGDTPPPVQGDIQYDIILGYQDMWNLCIGHIVRLEKLRLHEPYPDSWLYNWDPSISNVDMLKVEPVSMEPLVVPQCCKRPEVVLCCSNI